MEASPARINGEGRPRDWLGISRAIVRRHVETMCGQNPYECSRKTATSSSISGSTHATSPKKGRRHTRARGKTQGCCAEVEGTESARGASRTRSLRSNGTGTNTARTRDQLWSVLLDRPFIRKFFEYRIDTPGVTTATDGSPTHPALAGQERGQCLDVRQCISESRREGLVLGFTKRRRSRSLLVRDVALTPATLPHRIEVAARTQRTVCRDVVSQGASA